MLIGRQQGRSLEFNVIECNVIGFSLGIVDSCTMSSALQIEYFVTM